MVAIPVAGLIGSPISGAILGMDGVLGLGGWQWIFMLEALPTILLGIVGLRLADRPAGRRHLAGAASSRPG